MNPLCYCKATLLKNKVIIFFIFFLKKKLIFYNIFKISAEMILERLNLQDLLEEEKETLLELEKLKESQKSNPPAQKKSPCTRSEINKTTGILVERTIENIKSVNHSDVEVSNVSKCLPESESNENDKDLSESNQVQVIDGKSNYVRASQITSKTSTKNEIGQLPASQITNRNAGKKDKPNMDKSLNIQDVSLTEMLNSSNEDENPVNVSSIIGSLRVGQSLTDVASQSSLAGSSIQERTLKSDVPSRTSTPIRPHSGGGKLSAPPNKAPTSKSQLSLASTYNGPKSNTDSLDNQGKSAIRKTIENRLTQVNYKSTVSEQSKSEMNMDSDILTAIEGEHKLICVTNKQAKKSKEKAGKKLSSKLKEKLNIAISKDKETVGNERRDNNNFDENDDFEAAETTSTFGRKRKRIAVISDDDDDNVETSKINKMKNKMNQKDERTLKQSKSKSNSDKRRKVSKCNQSEKDSKSSPKETSKSKEELDESTNDSTPGSAVSKKTLSKLQKFAFDESKSSSSDSFLSNTSLSSSMLSGSLWISDDKSGKSSQKTDSGVDNKGSVLKENVKNIDKIAENKTLKMTKCVSEEVSIVANDGKANSTSKKMKPENMDERNDHIQGSAASKVCNQNYGDSTNNKLSQNNHTATIGNKLGKFKLSSTNSTVLQSSENTSSFNRSSALLNSTNSTVLKSSEDTSSLNRSSALLTGTSPSWLMALKSKKPSPIFTVSDTNDLDLDLDDLGFPENPLEKSKFS